MSEQAPAAISKWPYLLIDLGFLAVAGLICWQGHKPLSTPEIAALVLCAGAGAWVLLIPFRAELRIAESSNLQSTLAQIVKIEQVASKIQSATSLWQDVQDRAEKVTDKASEITDYMAAEAKAFEDFIKKSNDIEKGHLRLEIDKLRRGQNEWLQTLGVVMDHVYLLHCAARKSRQPRVAEQIAQFQNACRDAIRRLGIVPYEAEAGEAFDPARHQLVKPNEPMPDGALIAATLATGYTFQGQLMRKAIVSLQTSTASAAEEAPPAAEAGDLFQLKPE